MNIKENIDSKERIIWLDYAKAIGIFCVVLGHITGNYELKSFIYSFHIPLFFFISGVFFSPNRYLNYKSFFNKRFRQLLIPYFFFNLITYLFWLFIGRKVGNDIYVNPLKPFLGIFYGHLSNNFLEHYPPFWFITCLFITEQIYFWINQKVKDTFIPYVIFLFFIIGFIDSYLIKQTLPWGINVAFTAVGIYGLGNILKKIIIKENNYFNLFFLIIMLLLTILISLLNIKIRFSIREFGNFLYFLIGAFSGIYFVLASSKLLQKKFGKINLLTTIGQNTIIILSLHLIISTIIKGVGFYLFKIDISFWENNVIASLAFTIISITISLPIIFFITNYIPIIIGRKK